MTENNDKKVFEDSSEKPPSDVIELKETIQNLQKMIMEKQNKQEIFNQNIINKLKSSNIVPKKLNQIQDKLNVLGAKLKFLKNEKTFYQPAKPTPKPISVHPKKFTLKHIFKNVSGMEEGKVSCSVEEEHFGAPWTFHITRRDEHLQIFLDCQKAPADWSITAEFSLKIVAGDKIQSSNCSTTFNHNSDGTKFSWGYTKFISWGELLNDYVVNNELYGEAIVTIKKMTGIYKDNLMCFDESMKDLSDVVLVAQDKKFHVSKLFLATHSTYFKTMFLGMFDDSKKSEITLTGIDADDFHKYLEVLYGESLIEEATVEGILLLADMYDTQILIRKSEEFLMKESKKTLKKKLELAVRYNLEELKKKSLAEIKTLNDVRSVVSGHIRDVDPTMMSLLFEKSLSFK